MSERKIYNGWAFSSDMLDKRDQNKKVYMEIKDKAKLKLVSTGYAHRVYRVLENPENLSSLELALIADKGNLCFGYRMQGDDVVIHTD